MWFKRRKKTEQDHALSQSLRSLQTLLNETDRREPSLETRQPDADIQASGELEAAARPPVDGAVLMEPAPPDSASRWRDLNLSFDAEPVASHRSRHGTDIDAEDRAGDDPGEPEPGPDPYPGDSIAARNNIDPEGGAVSEPAFDSTGTADVPDNIPKTGGPSTDAGPIDTGELPEPSPADGGVISPNEQPKFADSAAAGHGEPDAPPTGEPAGIDWAEPDPPGGVLDTREPGEPATGDNWTENQLRLELEAADETGGDIPTLTEAVYVPDSPLDGPEPGEPAPAENSERCIEQLRARLQSVRLEPLSPEQEAQLRETLVEFLDKEPAR